MLCAALFLVASLSDPSPVSVVVTSPTDGAIVSNTITLSVNVTSTVAPIARVEYYLDGQLIATVTNPITPPSQLHEN